MLINGLFSLSLLSALLILGLVTMTFLTKDFQFWPPPNEKSWQHNLFRWLFRGMFYPLIGLSIMTFQFDASSAGMVRYGLGIILLIVGFGFALKGTGFLGWRNAFGEARGLKTDGLFAYSRNPIYVATWVGLIGWDLIANSVLVSILLVIWAIFYLAAPFLEEPWLEQEYGDDYRTYKKSVRRFL